MNPDIEFSSAERTDSGPPKLIVIVGPTAVGKTGLAIELALQFNGEIVNADSRYLYRGMDIGVAKPDLAERRGIPHHLIDICEPNEDMSLATYQELAMREIRNVLARGKVPIFAGGTPLYVNAVVEGWRIPRVPPQPAIRKRLEEEAELHGLTALAERLAQVDPIAAERSAQNLRRVIRALEIHEVTGQPMSELEGKGPRPFEALELGLTLDRERLYARADERVDLLIKRGLVEEVRLLIESGLSPDAPSMSSIGYRQLLPFLAGEECLDDAIAQIKTDTRRYIKHQETWLRKNKRLVSVDVSAPECRSQVADLVRSFLSSSSETLPVHDRRVGDELQ